jgi:hypothetical protein
MENRHVESRFDACALFVGGLNNPIVFAHEWLCDCGKRANPMGADWRWAGTTWEHHHGYPTGHIATERKPTDN